MATLIQNKQATFNHEILETFEAGLELFGHEVKSLRDGQGSLKGAHVVIRGGEAFLVGAHIPPYQGTNTPESYDPERARRLLLSKKELSKLTGTERQQGLTIVPISVYNKSRFLKIKIALVRGKKKHDKRHAIKKRDTERELKRDLKRSVQL